MPEFAPMTLLVTALLILVGFGFSGWMVAQSQALEKRLIARREDVLRHHVRIQPIDIRLFARPAAAKTSFKVRAASWFGVDLERPDICPLPWWIMVGAAAIIADIATSALSSLFGSLIWVLFPVALVVISRTIFYWFRTKRRNKLLSQFPDALMMIVRSVRVGVPVSEAMHIVAHEQPQPTASEFRLLANQLSIGEPLDKAIMSMARHADVSDYRFFAIALTLQSKAGGALSGTLEGLADLIRRRIAVKERAHALASEARMSIYVLTGLPVLVGGGMAILNPAYIGLLITDPLGNKLLTAAVMMLLTGLAVMQIIVKKSVS
ncbi:MAG TPA: secretion system protein [Acetobacteraceae bacterium]|jgi:tight adherence protein B|nr:secretion system protein [Acetobacteraceae bacterium]